MLPEDYVKGSSDDFSRRFRGTVITYDNEPAMVASSFTDKRRHIVIYPLDKDKSVEVPAASDLLSCADLGERLGFADMPGEKAVCFFFRVPRRGVQQGLSINNTGAVLVNSVGVVTLGQVNSLSYFTHPKFAISPSVESPVIYNNWISSKQRKALDGRTQLVRGVSPMSAEYAYALCSDGFHQMYTNTYPLLAEALKSGRSLVSLSRRFVLDKTDNNAPVIRSFIGGVAMVPVASVQGTTVVPESKFGFLGKQMERELKVLL